MFFSCRLPLIPLLPRKCLSFISWDVGPSLAQNSRPINAPDSKKKTSLHPQRRGPTPRLTQGYWTPSPLVRCCIGLPRYYEGLRHSVECFAAAYPRLLLSFSFYSLLQVFPSIIYLPFLFLYRRVLQNIIIWRISVILVNMNVNHVIEL